METSFPKSLLYSALAHALLFLLFFYFYKNFLVIRTPLLMELTLVGQMSQGTGLGSAASNPGEAPPQLPSTRPESESTTPPNEATGPAIPKSEKPEVALHKPVSATEKPARPPSTAYLEKLRKQAPIGLTLKKNVTAQIKTTGGLGHTGVAGTPEGNADIEGELAARSIKRQVNPEYPEWARKQGIEAVIKFRMTVLPNGLLREGDLLLEQTSGYRELDRVVYEALIQWEFNPLPPEVPQTDQGGIVTFSFNLK